MLLVGLLLCGSSALAEGPAGLADAPAAFADGPAALADDSTALADVPTIPEGPATLAYSPAALADSPAAAGTREPTTLIPALEVPTINLAIWAFDRFVLRVDYSFISFDSIARNLRGPWTLDTDSFEVNQLGHPYQGALSFTAARSSGHGFWTSMIFPIAGSLMWEYAMETDPPSLNDQTTTPIAGALLGESLHRLSRLLLYDPSGPPTAARKILSAAVNPMGALNRHVFGLRYDDGAAPPSLFTGALHVGADVLRATRPLGEDEAIVERAGRSLSLGVKLVYGLPDEQLRLKRPFDHFDFEAELSLSRRPFGLIAVRGLMWGGSWSHPYVDGLGGVYAMYDFFNPAPFRVSSSALGLGTTNALHLGERTHLILNAVAGPVVLGAAGLSESNDVERDYHLGPGLTSHLGGVLRLGDRAVLEVSARHHYLSGQRIQKGWESILQGEARAELRVGGNHGIGAHWTVYVRKARFTSGRTPEVAQSTGLLRLYWTWGLGVQELGTPYLPPPDARG